MALIVYSLGDDISTDVIYPGRFMATVLPTETPQFAFADDKEFNNRLKARQVPPSSVLVAGQNFGCGSSREQAVSCLKGHELTIVARGFARIFMQNAINLGLNVVTCPDLVAAKGDELVITDTEVINRANGQKYPVVPLPQSRRDIIAAGGLIAFTRQRLTTHSA
jgi:3-isopropylmalate/(R)-2-methylmalate dehydratase small subunit